MRTVAIPQTELHVSTLCYGLAGFGTSCRGAEAEGLLSAFIEAGGDFVDTAHCYAFWLEDGLGASERELGACVARLDARDALTIATKGGHPDGGPDYPRPDNYLAPEVIARDVQDSLERLGMETIDLYYLHRDDARVPVSEVIEALNEQIGHGHVRYLGASNWSVARIAEANAYAAANGLRGFAASQPQWSLARPTWVVGPDPTVRYITPSDAAWHAASQVPIVAYSATANGYFAGAGHVEGAFASPDNERIYGRAIELARSIGCSPTQLAVAWLLHQEATVVPLFSTASAAHLSEVIEATSVTLTPDQVQWLAAEA